MSLYHVGQLASRGLTSCCTFHSVFCHSIMLPRQIPHISYGNNSDSDAEAASGSNIIRNPPMIPHCPLPPPAIQLQDWKRQQRIYLPFKLPKPFWYACHGWSKSTEPSWRLWITVHPPSGKGRERAKGLVTSMSMSRSSGQCKGEC